MAAVPTYTGRFAPSPTGPLHAGSLVTGLASWLDARALGGRWLVRIEDTDLPRNVPGAEACILSQLAALGLHPDEPPMRQSDRSAHYAAALDSLRRADLAYPCSCSRTDLAGAPHPSFAAPDRCHAPRPPASPAAWRLRTRLRPAGEAEPVVTWTDRRLGASAQDISAVVGDVVLRRADGVWAYQLAVVVDDAAQGVTHVVRGEDLADNTPRQIHLQRLLGLPTPVYLHGPLVLASDGQKLSKQTGAAAIDVRDPLTALRHAGEVLGLRMPASAASPSAWLRQATAAWAARWSVPGR